MLRAFIWKANCQSTVNNDDRVSKRLPFRSLALKKCKLIFWEYHFIFFWRMSPLTWCVTYCSIFNNEGRVHKNVIFRKFTLKFLLADMKIILLLTIKVCSLIALQTDKQMNEPIIFWNLFVILISIIYNKPWLLE